jgi:localization factor PodJL
MAVTALAVFVTSPMGVAESFPEWKRKAEQGDATGQLFLGHLYAEGEGVPMDAVEAYKWYSLSMDGGNAEAAGLRDLLAKTMTRESTVEGRLRSQEFVPRIEPQSNPSARNRLPASLTQPRREPQ